MIDPDDFRAPRVPAPQPISPLTDRDAAFFRNVSLGAVGIVLSLIVVAAVVAPLVPPDDAQTAAVIADPDVSR